MQQTVLLIPKQQLEHQGPDAMLCTSGVAMGGFEEETL
jgi:hypothetical protein